MKKFLRKDLFFILIIVIFSSLFRIIIAKELYKTEYPHILRTSDSYFYYLRAKDIAFGDFLNKKIFISWPLYAFFLGFLLKIFSDNIGFVYLIQTILGISNCIFIYLIGKKFFPKAVAFIAAILCICYSIFIFYETLLIYTTLALFLNSLLLLYLFKLQNQPTKFRFFIAGIFSGICMLAQGGIFLFSLISIILLLIKNKFDIFKAFRFYFVFIVGILCIGLFVMILNYSIDKDIIFSTRNLGINFYIGNNAGANGLFKLPNFIGSNQEAIYRDSKIIARKILGKDLKDSEVSKFWIKNALAFITKYPAKYFILILKKIKYIFSTYEYFCDPEIDLFFANTKTTKILFKDLSFILPLALFGLLLYFKDTKKLYFLYAFIFSISLGLVLFFVSTKNRIPLVPILNIFAAASIYKIYQTLEQKRYNLFFLLLLIIFSFIIFMNKERFFYKKTFIKPVTYYLGKAIIYNNNGNYNKMQEVLLVAEKIEPDNPTVLFSLGTAFFYLNNLNMAEKYFIKALEVYPFYLDAYYNLGFIYNLERQYKKAKVVLKKLIELEPDDFVAHFELGKIYEASGEFDLALVEYKNALLKINRWRKKEIEIIKEKINSVTKKF
ncbi:MAG: glycosyltransferase family 39 protein [Candidatus Omnitrophica bacterium]|nr:glycosyltransferase family 39 protein [Candidatus Omnitrophota bacterium]